MNPAVKAFVDAAIAASAEVYGVSLESMTGDRGTQHEAYARHVAMYVVMVYGRMSSKGASEYFGAHDSTLRHARIVVRHQLANFPEEKERVSKIARIALEQSTKTSFQVAGICPGDLNFLRLIIDVLTNPQHASQASDLRTGLRCVTYSRGGALALHPFDGIP